MKANSSLPKPTGQSASLGLFLITTVALIEGATAVLLLHEPFAYPDGSLTGREGALGTTGPWASYESLHPADGWRVHQEGEASAIVVAPAPAVQRTTFDGTVANLPTSGGYAGLPGPQDVGEPDLERDFEIGRYLDASIALHPSVTASFQPRTTTWFSYVAVHAWDRNQETPNLAIGTDPTGPLGNRAFSLANGGSAIGAGGGPPRNNRADILPRYFSGGASFNLNGAATGWADDAKEAPDATSTMPWVASDADGFGAANIIVGRIEWDADTMGEDIITVVGFLESSTLTEDAFDGLVALKPNLSSRNWTANKPDLDQAQFDTLNIAGTKFFVDEIRLGTTFEDVIGATAPAFAELPEMLPDPDGKEADMRQPVQVYILLGQSNMLGFGKIAGGEGSLENAVKTKQKYPYLVDESGKWTERKDVRNVRVMVGKGGMQLFNNEWMAITGKNIGPEFGIGHYVGHVTDAPVMILKSCIGNRSLGWDLLPPGSEPYEFEGKMVPGYRGTPDDPKGNGEKVTTAWYAGKQYDDDTENAKKVLADLDTYYPGAKEYEIAGFFFWQGAKDTGNAENSTRYEKNLVQFIKQLRVDFEAPDAKFVVATLGQTTKGAKGNEGLVLDAQLAVDGETGKHPEFKGNVASVYANPFCHGGSANGHYNGNAETYMDVGEAMGRAMAALLGATSSK